jgi:hypothetical protein
MKMKDKTKRTLTGVSIAICFLMLTIWYLMIAERINWGMLIIVFAVVLNAFLSLLKTKK